MKTTLQKRIFDLSQAELKELLQPVAEEVLQKKWAKDGYITYHDDALCEGPDIMIHEYKDRLELVRIVENGKATLLNLLDNGNERTPPANDYRRA
ncbi:hypothetical protein [Mucilaginibacter phyllosphaerae]